MAKITEEKSERGECFFCEQPADIKIAYWSTLQPMAMTSELGWRVISVCENCNTAKKIVKHDALDGSYVNYA